MEDMLQNFTRLGMTDISFLIVNSRKERSQKMLPRLNDLVTFPIYQETSDEVVWEILGGGKDDMFVYDRQGRLVAYIPFPHSVLDRSLVSDLVLYAYNKDPCSETAAPDVIVTTEISTSLEDAGNQNYTTHFLNGTDDGNYVQDNLANRTNEIFPGDDINEILSDVNETVQSGSNNTVYQERNSSENTSHSEAQNHTILQGIYNSIWEIGNIHAIVAAAANFSTYPFDIPYRSTRRHEENKAICNDTDNCSRDKPLTSNDINDIQDITSEITNATQTGPKRLCLAEDEKVCSQWSKRQLRRIRRCCTLTGDALGDGSGTKDESMCKSFQKKRCKKLTTVIKCCLKIHLPDEIEEDSDSPSSRTQEIEDSPEVKLHKYADDHVHHTEQTLPKIP